MVSVFVRWTMLAAAGLSLAGCQLFHGIMGGSGKTKPPSPERPQPGWRDAVTNDDWDRVRGLRAAWVKALGQARAAGHAADLDALGALADPDVALDRPTPLPGNYRCRTIKLGAKSEGMLDYIAYPPFQCAITAETDGRLGFQKLTGSQRQKGILWPDAPRRMIFLGTIELGDERSPMLYGADRERDVAGALEQIGPARWRLALPWPRWESNLDVIELVPAD